MTMTEGLVQCPDKPMLEDLLARFESCRNFFDPQGSKVPSFFVRIPARNGSHLTLQTQQVHKVVLSAMIHGNECGPLREIVRFLENQKIQAQAWAAENHSGNELPVAISVVLGNPAAGLAGKRFLEQDLGRMFHADAPESYEKQRARSLMPFFGPFEQ